MAFTSGQVGAINAALGQYVTKKVIYTSDVMLSGKVLKLSYATYYDGGSPPSSPSFQILYPASPGVYEFTNINAKNFSAKLKVIDSQKFEIQYSFFVTKAFNGWNNTINSQALNLSSLQTYNLGIYISSTVGDILTQIPITVNAGCSGISFIESGFTPNVDLPVQIEINGSVNNLFYVGIIRTDNIVDLNPIYNGLFRSYSQIGNGVIDVEDFDNDYLVSGNGFNEVDNLSTASVTLDGSKLVPNASYQILCIYFQYGEWKSCLSQIINQAATNKPIDVTGLQNITDDGGNSAQSCVSGVSIYSPLDIQFDVDIEAFDNELELADIEGTFMEYFHNVKAFYARSPNAIGGFAIPFETLGDGSFKINNWTFSEIGTIYVIFQIEMRYFDHSDFINIPFQITYNAPVIDIEVTVLDVNENVVDTLCDGDEYIIVQTFEGCNLLESINSSPFVAVDGINIDDIPIESIACYKAVCIGEGVENPCECPPCESLSVSMGGGRNLNVITVNIYAQGEIEAVISGQTFTGSNVLTANVPATSNPFGFSVSSIITTADGCLYQYGKTIVLTDPSNPTPGMPTTFSYQDILLGNGNQLYCECEETEIPVCTNKANIIFECDEETGEVTLDVEKVFDSPIESELFLMSLDGVNFIPAEPTVSDQTDIFVTYDVIFSDGCSPLHIEQNIQCKERTYRSNQREIELANVANFLEITITDDFESTPLQDTLRVSLDNGLTFTEFDLLGAGYTPMPLIGNEKIVVDSNTIFADGENDFFLIKTLNLNESLPLCESSYDDYTLSVSHNVETGLFTVTKGGNETLLSENQLRWTLEGANPFDNNNSGLEYQAPVYGQGLFIAAWRIKLPNCETKIINAVAFGDKCINFCDPIEVNVGPVTVTLPEVLKVCLVECDCPGVELEIICVDHILTVSGFIPGSTITWTGPGGFTASGNDVEIELEGTYFVSVVDDVTDPDNPCTSNASYLHTEPDAGEPINDVIIVS